MAVIKAFKGIRPTVEHAEKVAALPYDVMSTQEAREMVADNPLSFLHVDKAEIDLDENIDPYDDSVYAKAKSNLDKLIEDGILVEDDKACLYIYKLKMGNRSQFGIVACTSVDEYLHNKIKKHEHTIEAKEQDRIRHVETCDANTGPIYLTYRSNNAINGAVDFWVRNNLPIYEFTTDDKITHSVWKIDDSRTIMELTAAFAQVTSLYIADGHHRNASAVKVAEKRRKADPSYSRDAEFNYYLSVCFPSDQLFIMDYNRIVKDLNGLTDEEFMAKIEDGFVLKRLPSKKTPSTLHTFSMYLSGQWYSLVARKDIIPLDIVGALDVSILQVNVFDKILGIENPRTDKRIDFVGGIRGLEGLMERVDSGDMKVAFAMFPTSVDQLMDIADAGQIMPPKSTWFEPKLRSGLFIHKLS